MKEENETNHLMASSLEGLLALLEKAKAEKGTLWFGISGSWRKTSDDVERDVRETVRKIIERRDGIVSGGALNVDYFATDEALTLNPTADRIKVFLPATLPRYAAHYRKRAEEGVITSDQAESLIAQLEKLKTANQSALIENQVNEVMNPTTYFERNTEVANASDALIGFQVNESVGVGDTVTKSLSENKPVYIKKYNIE